MTTWTTVSVETPVGDHFHRTEFGAWGQDEMDPGLPPEVTGLSLPRVCVIACNDTSDIARIAYSEWEASQKVRRREYGLWTFSESFGGGTEWCERISADLPSWCHAGGNWSDLDR